jgi:hypothetical protein
MSQRFRTLAQLDIALAALGWKLGVIIRLPYVPFVQMNYIMAVSRLSLRDFFISTAVGAVPGCVLYAYVGTTVRNLSAALTGKESLGPVPIVLTVGGVVIAIGSFVGLAFYARRVVRITVAAYAEAAPLVPAPDDAGSSKFGSVLSVGGFVAPDDLDDGSLVRASFHAELDDPDWASERSYRGLTPSRLKPEIN